MKVYVASSWRNHVQPFLVQALIGLGHEVYDFRKHTDPRAPRPHVFAWTEIDEAWEKWSPDQYLDLLTHPAAEDGFETDMRGLKWADTVVLCLPCGRSAHLEAGWAKGSGRRLFVLLNPTGFVPELMYLMADGIFTDYDALVKALVEVGEARP